MITLIPFLNFPIALYHLRCKKCKRDFYAETYDEMETWTIIHCNKCGDVVRIDWYSPLSKKVQSKAYPNPNVGKGNSELTEYYLKPCSCGGRFLFKARPRCPYCHSDHTEKQKGIKEKSINYDPDSIWKDEVKDL